MIIRHSYLMQLVHRVILEINLNRGFLLNSNVALTSGIMEVTRSPRGIAIRISLVKNFLRLRIFNRDLRFHFNFNRYFLIYILFYI